MISLAVTHYERFDMLCEALEHAQDDPRIDEIIISDDASEDGSWKRLKERFGMESRFKLYRNERNLDCYFNKAIAVERSAGPWVILFDSDNILSAEYLDAIMTLNPWERQVAYLPTFAEPEFDYRKFEGLRIDRSNVAGYMDDDTFRTALNTANYFFHRDEYLRVWDPATDPHTVDSMYQNFLWLQAGNALQFVPGMRYFHRVHDASHFVLNDHKTGTMTRRVETLLRMLR